PDCVKVWSDVTASTRRSPREQGRSCAVLRAFRPGMDRLVAVHVLDIAQGHLAQRLRAVGSAFGECCGRLDLPGGAVPAGETALLDDAQQAVGILWIDAPAGQ